MKLNIYPTNYKLTLEPDLKNFIFKGHEIITLHLETPTKLISLDSVNIKVFTCKLNDKDLSFEQKQDKLNIVLPENIDKEIQLSIEFQGELNDKLAGFYRSKYEEDGKEEYLATTQFEAADARQAFPCFDEPLYKATFDITLIIEKEYAAISNMPVILENTLEDGRVAVSFDTTPIMSTYLVYFGVGKFQLKQDRYNNILIRGITTKGKAEYTDFAIDCAKKSLEYFENYFKIPYPLPKLDLLAIPDFASGAMENWGAITFRENLILFYPGKSSLSTTQRIAEVVCHEVAHQWFGNLVTMKWWDDLWLNESFATFMSYKVLDNYWPEWNVWTDYLILTIFEGMQLDSLKSSHSIKVNVKNVEEMNELFDEIAYDKGGGVLRMMERYMGDVNFRDGLRNYMDIYKYKNAEAHNLWSALEKSAQKPVVKVAEDFITKVGFPVVTIKQKQETYTVSQSRFSYEIGDESKWLIPLITKYGNGSEETQMMESSEIELKPSTYKLLSVNADYGSFFISHYATELLEKIGQDFADLNDREKIGLIHDLYYLTYFKKESFTIFISFINKYVANEESKVVIYYILGLLKSIYSLHQRDDIKLLMTAFAENALENIGYEPRVDDSTDDTFLRSSALSTLSELDHKKTNTFLTKKFKLFIKDQTSLHPDLRAITYRNAVWSNEDNYDVVKQFYIESSIQEEKVKLLAALAYSKSKIQIHKTLKFCLTDDVRFGNIFFAVSAASKNQFGKEIVLNWMIQNWDEFGKRVGGHGGVLLRRFVKIIVPECGIGYESEIKAFIDKNRIEGLEKTFEQITEELKINQEFVKVLAK